MDVPEGGRSARKHKAILEAATQVFLAKGYLGTSMDEVAALAAVSKQTVYKHFADKDSLFAEIVMATTGEIDDAMQLVAELPVNETTDQDAMAKALGELARRFLDAIMRPRVLQLRRLIIANADRFPDLGATWYREGFERGLATLANTFRRLADQGQLAIDDPTLAAEHFAGLVLWIPVNRAMFHGTDQPYTQAELDHLAEAAASVFINAHSPTR